VIGVRAKVSSLLGAMRNKLQEAQFFNMDELVKSLPIKSGPLGDDMDRYALSLAVQNSLFTRMMAHNKHIKSKLDKRLAAKHKQKVGNEVKPE